MFTDLFKIIDVPIEKLIAVTEDRLERLEPGLRWGHWPNLFVIAVLSSLFGWLIFAIEAWLSHTVQVPDWLAFVHNPVAWLIPILTVVVVSTLKLIIEYRALRLIRSARRYRDMPPISRTANCLRNEAKQKSHFCFAMRKIPRTEFFEVPYRKDKNRLANDIRDVKSQLETIKTSMADADSNLAIRLTKELEASRDKTPFKELFEALNPNNEALSKQFTRIERRALSSLERLARLNELPDAARQALEKFLDLRSIAKPWGPLYLTFAINLQLEPWTRAANSGRFVFMRDSEAYKYDYGDVNQATIAFRDRLEMDLEEILKLVEHKLWSTMYKDMAIWNIENYRRANDRLYSSMKNANLRRLFFYESNWLTETAKVLPLYRGAKWHQRTGYPCRFNQVPKNSDGPVFEQRPDFLSSCVLNSTWIVMYFRDNSNFQSYLYRCDSEDSTIRDYEAQYSELWEQEQALEPSQFIAFVEQKCPGLKDKMYV